MNVEVKRSGHFLKGTTLELTPIETMTVLEALKCLHRDGGRNELDRVASKDLRKQILDAMKG